MYAALVNVFAALGTAPPGVAGPLATLVSWTTWGVLAIAGPAIVVTGGKMIWHHRQGAGGQHASSLGWIFGGSILAAGSAGLIQALGLA